MENSLLLKLLQKYSKGTCTSEERDLVDAWFEQQDKNPDDLRLLDERLEKKLGEKMLVHIKIRANSSGALHRPLFRATTIYRIAAAIIVLFIVGAGIILMRDHGSIIELRQPVTFNASPTVSISNTSELPRTLSLNDGTSIRLQPKGTVTYPKEFSDAQREVQLQGEAFFDVAKDRKRPFIISTENVTVKVLGTSFNVKAYEKSDEVTVAVRTGKVSVFAKNPDYRRDAGTNNEIILTPNQEVVYSAVRDNFQKKIVARPEIILARPTIFEMRYDGTQVDKIFEVMEENYGIDIVFDKEVLSSCTLTTSMAEEGFYERIAIICHAIGAQYDVKDATIIIKSAGCQ